MTHKSVVILFANNLEMTLVLLLRSVLVLFRFCSGSILILFWFYFDPVLVLLCVFTQELGPRFTLKMRWLQEGTFDTQFGEYEWIHKRREMDVTRRTFHL